MEKKSANAAGQTPEMKNQYHIVWQASGGPDQLVSRHRTQARAEEICARKQTQFMRRWQSWHTRPLARFTVVEMQEDGQPADEPF